MMRKTYLKVILGLCGVIVLTACAPTTGYKSLQDTKLSSFFSVQDQVNLVHQLSTKLVNDPNVKQEINGAMPSLLISKIVNKTDEHIDTQSITDTLQVDIIENHLFKIIDRSNLNLLSQEQKLNSMGLTDSQQATQIGKLWGAKYVLYGNFSSIVNYVGSDKNTFYKLTLFLQNIETGQVIWVGEGSVNKVTS